MGTRVRMVAAGESRIAGVDATEVALREIERVERLLSTWDTASELGAFNAAGVERWVVLSPELANVLAEVEAWASRTERAFDPRVGALLDVWGLRGPARVPTRRELAAAMEASGPGAFRLEDGRGMRNVPEGWVDAGAFGKGFALRSLAEKVDAGRVHRMLVDLGGQIWAHAPRGEPWTVRVAHPGLRDRSVARLSVHEVSVATSGMSERPDHLLDPRTGRPAPAWGSVTVVSPDPMEADVLSTALYVMGPDRGFLWAVDADVAALFLEDVDGAIEAHWTPAMRRWMDPCTEP